MATARLGHFWNLLADRKLSDQKDGDLLRAFVSQNDQSAFEALLFRHGAMVLRVCLRNLANADDAEDAFQATFLVLARHAASIRKRESLAGWLHGVAYRMASHSKRAAARRLGYESQANLSQPSDPARCAALRELQALVDEELVRLPEALREAFVACCLENKSCCELADQLGLEDSTIRKRVSRARKALQERLNRRGVSLTAALTVAAVGANGASAALPRTLVGAIVKAAAQAAAGRPFGCGVVSAKVVALVEGVNHAILLTKCKALVLLLVSTVIVGTGLALGLVANATTGSEPVKEAPPPVQKSPPEQVGGANDPNKNRGREDNVDGQPIAEPLPPGVSRRLGADRFRYGKTHAAVRFTPDGAQLVSANWFGEKDTAGTELALFDVATGKLKRSFARTPGVRCDDLNFPDAKTVVVPAGGNGKPVELVRYELARGVEVGRIPLDGLKDTGPSRFSRDGKAYVVGYPGWTRVFDTATGKKTAEFRQANNDGQFFALSADGNHLFVSLMGEKLVRQFNVKTGKVVRDFSAKNDQREFETVAVSPDGLWLAGYGGPSRNLAVNREYDVFVWNARTGEQSAVCAVFNAMGVLCLEFSPDSKQIYVGDFFRTVTTFDPKTGKLVQRNQALGVPCALTFAPDGKSYAVGTDAGLIMLWDSTTGKRLPQSPAPTVDVGSLQFSPDGKRLSALSNELTTWDTTTGREVAWFDIPTRSFWPAAIAPGGTKAAARTDAAEVVTIDLATGRHTPIQFDQKNDYVHLAFSADGRTLYTANWANGLVIGWDVSTGKKIHEYTGHAGKVAKMVTTRDGKLLATCASDAGAKGHFEVRLWNTETGKEIEQFQPRRGSAFDLAFSPDGRRLAAVGGDPGRLNTRGEVQVWDIATGKELGLFDGHLERVTAVAFSADGRMLATTAIDKTVRLWEVATGTERWKSEPLADHGTAVSFSPDGKTLATAIAKVPVYLWTVRETVASKSSPTAEAVRAAMDDLGSTTEKAFQTAKLLAAHPAASLPAIRDRLPPAPKRATPDAKRVAELIAALDAQRFADREAAAKELAGYGNDVRKALEAAAKESSSAEVRQRAVRLLDDLSQLSNADLRAIRIVEVVEWMGTAEAVGVLKQWAAGGEGERLTEEARAGLRRLKEAP